MISETTINNKTITATQNWLEKIVIGLNLCPFAKRPFVKNRIRFVVCKAKKEEKLLLALQEEINYLILDESIATTLLIHPNTLIDFASYNQFLEYGDNLLEYLQLADIFQIASFHPEYQFANTQKTAVENYTNRSPYPMLHILRQEAVSKAVDNYPSREPERNIKLLRGMGIEAILALLDDRS